LYNGLFNNRVFLFFNHLNILFNENYKEISMTTTVIEYRKTADGPVIVSQKETDLDKKPNDVIERFWAFFTDVPLHGGQEWETLSADEIAAIFQEAAAAIEQLRTEEYNVAVAEHNKKNCLARWWDEKIRGWKAPRIGAQSEIMKKMSQKCRNLADWMEINQHRAFYVNSDMSYLIRKPRAVAELLARVVE
jgi:hypothetical protein